MTTVTLVGNWTAGTVPAAANGSDSAAFVTDIASAWTAYDPFYAPVVDAMSVLNEGDTAAAMAVLVADAASPTQAHVDDLVTAWGVLEPLIDDAVAVGSVMDKTDFDAAVGVLDADAASPTEAHVDDAVAAWDILLADLTADVAASIGVATALDAAAAASTVAHVLVTVDLASVGTLNKLDKVLKAIRVAAEGSGRFTP